MADKEPRDIEYIRLDDEHIAEVYETKVGKKQVWGGVIRKRGAEVGRVDMCQSPSNLLVRAKEILAGRARRQSVDYQLLTEVTTRSGEVGRYTFTLYDADNANIDKLSQTLGEEGNRSLAIRYAVAKVVRDMGL